MWIDETKEKPEFNTPVLVCCRVYGTFIAIYEQIDDTEFGQWVFGAERGILPPTHWMPLPKKPYNY